MALIHVPRPENAWNPNRAVNALLKSQVLHLHEAELKLPVRRQTDIYINAIKTEGEAAGYVRQVTEAIHAAHQTAAAKRARSRVKRTSKVRTKKKKKMTPKARPDT
jgi:uncharacterized protein YdbL (DUF1318 family)